MEEDKRFLVQHYDILSSQELYSVNNVVVTVYALLLHHNHLSSEDNAP